MAAKLLHSLADDNPDLQKQIGCMTGIIQLFDCHHVLTGRRLSHKRLPPGTSHFQNGRLEGEFNHVYRQQTTNEINLNQTVNEKHRISTESSRASFSSSCSSARSSVDLWKTAQQEASSGDRITFPETPSRDSVMSQGNTSPHMGRHSLDLRDVVKDSMYREARGLSVKTTTNDEPTIRSLKHEDSSRPVQLSKSADGSYGAGISGKQSLPADLRESLRVLAKLREAQSYNNEAREVSKSLSEANDVSRHTISRDAPRFSYEGKEVNRLSFKSRDTFNSTPRLKEMPRLSLDSREYSMRGSNSDSKPNCFFKNLEDSGSSNNEVRNLAQSLGTQNRSPSVVAKLMGLDALPVSSSDSDNQLGLIKTSPVEEKEMSLKSDDLHKLIQVSRSIRSSLKDPVSPRWKKPDWIMKPVSNSKFPMEPAPWKQLDGSRGSQKTAFRPIKVPAKAPNSFPSVYSEIEKRLKDLKFKQSGKDFRASKQILEVMQAKWSIESSKEYQASNFGTQKDSEFKSSNPNRKPRGQWNLQSNRAIDCTAKGSTFLKTFESPIVIMKPAKLVQKSNIPASSVIPVDNLSGLQKLQGKGFEDSKKASIHSQATKDQSPKSGHIDSAVSTSNKKTSVQNTRYTQSSTKPQQLAKESTTNSAKCSGSVSPRLQQRKLELEKRSRSPTPPADLNKPRRQSNRHLVDSDSPVGKLKHKSRNSQPCDDQLSQLSNESKSSSHHGDKLDSRIDVEFSSIERSQSPSMKSSKFSFSGPVQKKSTPILSEDEALAELATLTPEHPSPVSVFDTSVLREDDPSPEKQMPNVLKGDVARNLNDSFSAHRWNSADKFLSSSLGCALTSEINRKKLQNIEHLVQKLRRLNSSHNEASTDYIASLCENTNPDHRYISEILLASGLLLRDLGSSLTTYQCHPSGHPINPELFFVLEQTNANTVHSKEGSSALKVSHLKTDHEKIRRKLIFDAVNEILLEKLALAGASQEPWLRSNQLAPKTMSAQKLLKELCFKVEQLQAMKSECSLDDEDDNLKSILWEDVTHRSGSWTNFNNEISVLVLDVERLVFKDLVDEIVIGEASNLRARPGRRRQLFAK